MIAGMVLASGCIFGSSDSNNPPVGTQNNSPADAANVSPNNDNDTGNPGCGDSLLSADETCDPGFEPGHLAACPTSCDDGIACTKDTLLGSAQTCDAVCESVAITSCEDGDGCCPADCSPAEDDDCAAVVVCGDAELSGPETCDPPSTCPTVDDCPAPTCSMAVTLGSDSMCNVACSTVPIIACADDDGCCPQGCDSTSDVDCSASCGNGTVEQGERCDGTCPTACDDGNACTTDTLNGDASTCDAFCTFVALTACVNGDNCCPAGCTNANDDDCSATCGDGVVDPQETCDPIADCPTSCDDGSACTIDTLTGSAATCNASCSYVAITACTNDDGCCPTGCNAVSDNDCNPVCGNGVREPPEVCDGSCPTMCDDNNACTSNVMIGSADTCDARCTFPDITACTNGDGCCPSQCNANNDNDCGPVCGNGVVETGETCDGNCPATCDDGNPCTVQSRTGSAAQCNVQCITSVINMCVSGDGCCPNNPNCSANNDDDCSASCGNGVVEGGETCDGNCPTSESCKAMGGCFGLSGSAANCSAECLMQAGCVSCANSCPCLDGEICNDQDVCEPSGDESDCSQACDPDAFCAAHSGSEFTCRAQLGICAECVDHTECAVTEYCESNQCFTALNCGEAGDPDAYCDAESAGTVCVIDPQGFGTCRAPCLTPCDCPQPHLQMCLSTGGEQGFCMNSLDCTQVCPANQDEFCEYYFPQELRECTGNMTSELGCERETALPR